MSWTCMQRFSFIPLTASGEKIFDYFFENLPFILPWQPIKFSDLDKIHMNRRGLLKKHFCKKKMLYVKYGNNRLHGFRRDVVWKNWQTDGRRTDNGCLPNNTYTVSSPMSLRLRWAKNWHSKTHEDRCNHFNKNRKTVVLKNKTNRVQFDIIPTANWMCSCSAWQTAAARVPPAVSPHTPSLLSATPPIGSIITLRV